ncbi:hypothetical protein EJ05DRAFT_502453 [Pseudovirgaria hyperparasitica]|uniref:Asl1-like glycosyl hydrolase catalytic domain-containing protein n=1 Tax=Pseudovirgaria hyperparasitica TaxID=470096 RepID=A0A6A6W1G9_9PEZI|nr:uncharacterized protein EJ05DRAFT_502453 [Pseudovirgaria hyperparasitica]KAF2755979.1 hypothetical protein EJ05DRAFT_502453 [Pseudovirgaria hyperparasitica]
MLKAAYIHFVLVLLAACALAQTTVPCKCTSTMYWRTYTLRRTVTGSASCTSLKLTPTCPTSTPTSTSKASTVATPTSSKPTTTSTTPKPSSSSAPTPTPTSTPKPSSTSFSTSTTSPKPSSTSTSVSTTSSKSSTTPSPSPTSTSSPKPSSTSLTSTLISTTSSKSSTTPSPSPISTTSPKPSTTSTTSSKPASSSTITGCAPTPTNKSSGTKRGVSYNDLALTNLFSTSCVKSKASWAYNWYSAPANQGSAAAYNTALTFIPMLWSAADALTSVWNANANAAIANGAKALLSFNEPDGCSDGGSCMNATYAAQSYKTWMQPFAGKAKIGAPGITNGGAPMGLTYLQNFMQACSGCTIDFITIHWYSDASQISAFKSYVQQAYTAGGNKPIWITEFGCTSGTDAQVQAFMKDVLPWLDAQSYVEKYAFFGAFAQNPSAPFLWQETLVNQAGTALSNTGVIYDQI